MAKEGFFAVYYMHSRVKTRTNQTIYLSEVRSFFLFSGCQGLKDHAFAVLS